MHRVSIALEGYGGHGFDRPVNKAFGNNVYRVGTKEESLGGECSQVPDARNASGPGASPPNLSPP